MKKIIIFFMFSLFFINFSALFAQEPKKDVPLTKEEKLAQQQADMALEAQQKDLEKAQAEVEGLNIAQEEADKQAVEQARKDADLSQKKFEEEMAALLKQVEADFKEQEKIIKEEEDKLTRQLLEDAERESKEIEKKLKKVKLRPPSPRK